MFPKKFYFEVFVPSNEHAAEIIGFKGYKVKRISRETQTYIQCPSPNEPPIFKIFGDNKKGVEIAKEKIQSSAAHFDDMRNKKRQISIKPDEVLQTVWLKKSDIPCIIGRRGKQIKRIMEVTKVTVISPDTNKESIFIICGREKNVEVCVLIMKIIAFCMSGFNYFNGNELNIINDFLNNNIMDANLLNCIYSLINFRICINKFKYLNYQRRMLQRSSEKQHFYKCWNCKNNRPKIARTLCHHIISCDSCIVHLYADIYLKCKACDRKIENFIIEPFSEFIVRSF